jgi:N-carbamoylputrescine amidase
MKIALIQQHATFDVSDNCKRGIAAFRTAAEAEADLIAFAELAFLPFLPQYPSNANALQYTEPIPGPTTMKFAHLSKEYGVVTVLNLYEREGNKMYDASPVIDVDGTLVGVTRMMHIMEGPGFHEKAYYTPGDLPQVFQTQIGRVGVAICYDRHFPEYMRILGIKGAELVIIPQAGAIGEWPQGIFQAEVQVAAFQNGYYAALVNRVGREEIVDFSGNSFIVNPTGQMIAQAPSNQDTILYGDCDFGQILTSPAKTHFLLDRRPDQYYQIRKKHSP